MTFVKKIVFTYTVLFSLLSTDCAWLLENFTKVSMNDLCQVQLPKSHQRSVYSQSHKQFRTQNPPFLNDVSFGSNAEMRLCNQDVCDAALAKNNVNRFFIISSGCPSNTL